MSIQMNNDKAWLSKMAMDEEYACVSAGGLYIRMVDEQQTTRKHPANDLLVLGRLVELARREKGMSVSAIAEEAQLDLTEVLAIEQGRMTDPEPRVLFMLAKSLDLPIRGLMELGGLMEQRDKSLEAAAVRFAANSEPTEQLTPLEKEALKEFVKVLAEYSEGG